MVCGVSFYEKVSMILVSLCFFVILIFCLCFYGLIYYHYRYSNKTAIYCGHLRNQPQSFKYKASLNIINLLQSAGHAILYLYPSYQIGFLASVTVLHLIILIKYSQIFELMIHFFVYLFHQISRLLFLLTLLFHSLNEK